MLLVREVYSDWDAERRGTIGIHRADRAGLRAARAGHRARWPSATGWPGKILLSRLRTFLAFPEWFYLKLPVNTMTAPRPTPGGLATQFSSAGHYDLGDDQAMIVTVPAAGQDLAPYQGIQLGSMWYISLDYINHQTSLTADQARTDPDGRLRFVISERDPGVANWLECTGHRRGYVQIRWQRLARDLGPADGPRVEVVPFDDLPRRAAVLRAGAGDARGVRGADRRPPGRRRREDAGLMRCWRDKVVVVSGVGPGLGRSIALPGARAGRRRGARRPHGVPAGRGGQGGHRARAPRRWPSRPTSPTARRPRGWPRPRWPSSAGSTRWCTTRSRCRRSPAWPTPTWPRSRPPSTPTWSPRCG